MAFPQLDNLLAQIQFTTKLAGVFRQSTMTHRASPLSMPKQGNERNPQNRIYLGIDRYAGVRSPCHMSCIIGPPSRDAESSSASRSKSLEKAMSMWRAGRPEAAACLR